MQSCGIRYAGSKGRCGAMIRSIQSVIPAGGIYWEPFVGSGKIIQRIKHCERHGSDIDEPIITLLQAVQKGWEPPTHVSEQEYKYWMRRRAYEIHPMMGFVGYGCSFGARYFQGYARSKKGQVNFARSARKALLAQKPFLKGVKLSCADYRWSLFDDFDFHPNVIYCDPPYKGTKPCGSCFDHFSSKGFWEWAVQMSEVSIVLVSEYTCPVKGAIVLWEQKTAAGIRFGTKGDGGHKGSGKKKLEKLFCLRPDVSRKVGLGVL